MSFQHIHQDLNQSYIPQKNLPQFNYQQESFQNISNVVSQSYQDYSSTGSQNNYNPSQPYESSYQNCYSNTSHSVPGEVNSYGTTHSFFHGTNTNDNSWMNNKVPNNKYNTFYGYDNKSITGELPGITHNQYSSSVLNNHLKTEAIESQEEVGYQIPKKEFNTFKLTSDETPIRKEDIFKGNGDEAFEQVTYVENSYNPIMGDSSKSYFKKLYSLPVPPEVKRKVEEDIIASNKRIHLLPDEVICSLVINAHQHLGLDFDIVSIFAMFGIDPRKNNILQLLQKVSTKITLASNQENAFAMIVVEPSKYISEIFNLYLAKIQYNFRDKEQTIDSIKRIMIKLEEMYPPLVQKPPRECASILVYLYLRGNLDINSRQIFNKKIFSELPGIVSTKFDSCFNDLERKFNDLFRNNPTFMATCYPYNQGR